MWGPAGVILKNGKVKLFKFKKLVKIFKVDLEYSKELIILFHE